MKKILLVTAVGVLLTGIVSAQKKNRGTDGSDKVKYTLISDSEDFNFIGGGFGINLTGSSYNTNLGFDTGLSAHLGKLDLSFWYYRQTSGLTAGDNTSSDDAISLYDYKATKNLDMRAAFAIKSTTENKELHVIVKATGNSSMKILYYVPVPALEKTMYMAELGFNKGVTYYKGYGKAFEGQIVGGTGSTRMENRLETYMQYTMLQFGASRVKCARVQINATDLGVKEEIYYNKIYGRISYMLSSELDDVLVPGPYISQDNEHMYYQYNLQTNTEMSKMGINFGYSSYTPNKFRSYWYAEAGITPGPKSGFTKAYVGFGFGVYISKLFN